MQSYQGQGVAQEDKPGRGFGQLIGEIIHLGVDFAIFGSDLLGLFVDDVYRSGQSCALWQRGRARGVRRRGKTGPTDDGLGIFCPRRPQTELAQLLLRLRREGVQPGLGLNRLSMCGAVIKGRGADSPWWMCGGRHQRTES